MWVDLQTFERDFRNRFDYVHPEQALYMIKDRVQKPLESVAEYRNRFYRMFVRTERGEQVRRDLSIDGLRSRTIRAKLRKQFSPINHTLQQIMDAADDMERKFTTNFLEGEDYLREGDSSEVARAKAKLAALQNKFENMGFVSGPVTYIEQIAPKRPAPSEILSVPVSVMPTPVRTAPSPPVEAPVRSNESIAILELTKTLVSLIQESKKEQREQNARLEAMMRNMRPIAVRAPSIQQGLASSPALGGIPNDLNVYCACHQPGHLARDCTHRPPQQRVGVAPMAAAPIANGPGRVRALMEEIEGGGSALATTEEAIELIPLDQYVSPGYPGLGMIGTIRPAPEQKEVAEWRPSLGEMESRGPTFVTGEIDVLNIVRALDHRIPLPIGHLLSISEQANERMLQHYKANRKRFALARVPNAKTKSPTLKENLTGTSDPIRVGLVQKDNHFLRIKSIPWKSAECDIEIWGIPYNAIIDSGASVLAISLRVVERVGRKNDLIMLTEKDQLVSADEEKIKTVGRMTNVAFRLGKVHALGDVVVLDRAMNMTFQNFVNKTRLTQGMINFCVIVYMDDILVYSQTYHGHTQHIEWTLGALRDAGFKIALEKSEFFLSKISFLGYVLTRGGLRPDSRKVAAVKEAPVPTSLTQVRAFLGLASYYRRFIKGFAAIARPLTNLLRKDQPLSWDAECQQAFPTLKDAMATAPILTRSDSSKQFIIITDWQPEAISAILAQKGNNGREHVIEYASRTVPDERRNDSAPQAKFFELSFCLLRVNLNWTWEGDRRPSPETVELIVIQAWRTNVVGDLLGFVFGAVDRGYRSQIARELTIVIARQADELPLDIVSQSDEEPLPNVLSRTLAPSLQWSACIEERWADDRFPSRSEYLDVHSLTNPRFFRQPTALEWAALKAEEEAEEESEGELRREAREATARLAEDEEEEREAEAEAAEVEDDEEEEAEGETSEEEEEAYSEHNEREQSEEEEEDDDDEGVESGEDDREPAHDDELEWVPKPDRREENPEAAAQHKEGAEGKRRVIDPTPNDPSKDPEPPKPEHGDLAATTSSAATTRRRPRSRSSSPSASTRPPIRQRVDEGLRPSSPIHIPLSP
ncbi:hypothetical protein CBR_g8565 [Chara braunii]|uniref:CCHC-type domain-containing protein n=1 Tax=Chara braunii TaxID=69332 RepID=A0A388JRW5_CHABU|nr:hypothetical protein CBR_g8565 [Chara braunii]|eukprot:GBG60541.1 hypothetical protein CBR_g8565 [Chara braunii]